MTRLPYSEARRLIGPRGRVESPEAKRPGRVSHADEAILRHITSSICVQVLTTLLQALVTSIQYITLLQYPCPQYTHPHWYKHNTGYMSTHRYKFTNTHITSQKIHKLHEYNIITRRNRETQKRQEHSPKIFGKTPRKSEIPRTCAHHQYVLKYI